MAEGKSPEIAACSQVTQSATVKPVNWTIDESLTIAYLSLSVLVLESDNVKGLLPYGRQLFCVTLKVCYIFHRRDQGFIATSTYIFDSHMLLPSYRYGNSKSLDGIAGTLHGLVDEGSGKREFRRQCFHQIPESYNFYHTLN